MSPEGVVAKLPAEVFTKYISEAIRDFSGGSWPSLL